MIRYDYQYPADAQVIRYLPAHAVFLDIETTGLKKETAIITLIGCGYIENDILHIIQWFNDDAISEETMLRDLEGFLASRPFTLVTFNGDYFDLPFLRSHFYYNELISDRKHHPLIDQAPSLDLFQMLRGYAPFFPEGSATQKSMEKYIGIVRDDQCSGGQLISLYRDYLKTKNETSLSCILLHNREDVRYLASLPSLLSLDQLKRGTFAIESLEETSYQGSTALRFCCHLNDPLPGSFSLETKLAKVEMVFKEDPGHAVLSDESLSFSVTVPVHEGTMYHYYPDYRNYYYLPLEDRAIHKSVGTYVEKEHRCKANPENCYYPLESVFLPLPESGKGYGFRVDFSNTTSLPLYRRHYKSKNLYLNFDDLFSGQDNMVQATEYVTAIIQAILLQKNKEKKKRNEKK